MKIYWADFLISMLAFVVCFAIGNPISYIIASIFLYRLGAFTHEICHQYKNPKIRTFKKVWTWTVGFMMMQSPIRFMKPHLAHHTTGIFATENDPQYPLIRSDWKLAIAVFILLPIILPIYNLLVCAGMPDKLLYGKIEFTPEEMNEIRCIEVAYVLMLQLVLLFFTPVVVKFYFVAVGAWFLSVLRIPLEHSLRSYKKTSTIEDQRLDSFTHTNPVYVIVQPVGLRYHTLHHMHPRIPYHNLAKMKL